MLKEWACRPAMVLAVAVGLGGCGTSSSSQGDATRTERGDLRHMGLREKLNKRPAHDEAGIRKMLEDEGASPDEASTIVRLLSRRLTAEEMHVWLSHPEKSHGIPDPESAKEMEDAGLVPVVMKWTPVSAVSAGKTQLVVNEAERFAAGG